MTDYYLRIAATIGMLVLIALILLYLLWPQLNWLQTNPGHKPQRIHMSVITLTELQLSAWQKLEAELSREQAPLNSLIYCRRQIHRLQQEVAWLSRQPN